MQEVSRSVYMRYRWGHLGAERGIVGVEGDMTGLLGIERGYEGSCLEQQGVGAQPREGDAV